MAQTRGREGRIPHRSLGRGVPKMLTGHYEHIGALASAPQLVGFSIGSYDTSLLVKYEHHIARHLWSGEVSKINLFYIE